MRPPFRAKSVNKVTAGNFCVSASSANRFVFAPINTEDNIKMPSTPRWAAAGNAASRSLRLRTSKTSSPRLSGAAAALIAFS